MSTTTVSARIPEELKRELEEQGIDVSETVRRALEAEVRRRKRDTLKRTADELNEHAGGALSRDDLVTAVRDSRRDR